MLTGPIMAGSPASMERSDSFPLRIVSRLNTFNDTGKRITKITSRGNYLYVTLRDAQFNQRLEVWDVRDPRSPRMIQAKDYGNIASNPNDVFKFPQVSVARDLIVVRTDLRDLPYGSAFDGTIEALGPQSGYNLNFLSQFRQGAAPLNVEGALATYEGEVGPGSDPRAYQQVLLNLTNPRRPFPIKGYTDGFDDDFSYKFTSSALNDVLDGVPATLSVKGNTIHVSKHEFNVSSFVENYWEPTLERIFDANVFNGTFRSEINRMADSNYIRSALADALDRIWRSLGLDAAITIEETIHRKFQDAQKLEDILDAYQIDLDEPVDTALEKVVSAHIESRFQQELAVRFFADPLKNWVRGLLNTDIPIPDDADVGEISNTISSILNEGLDATTVAVFLIDRLLAPMIDYPEWVTWTLAELIRHIDSTEMAKVMTTAIRINKNAVTCFGIFEYAIEKLASWHLPRGIPDDSADILEYAFYENGIHLKENEVAFIAALKFYSYYSGNKDYLKLEERLNAHFHDMQRQLAAALLEILQPYLSILQYTGGIRQRIADYAAEYPAVEIVTRSVAEEMSARLRTAGIDTNLSVRLALKSRGLYIAPGDIPYGGHAATVEDFANMLRSGLDANLADASLREMYQDASSRIEGLQFLVQQVVFSAVREAWGEMDSDMPIGEGIRKVLAGRLDMANAFAEPLKKELGSFVSSAGSTFFFNNIQLVQRAWDGDIIARWQLTIKAAAHIGDILSFISMGYSEAFATACRGLEFALDNAYEQLTTTCLKEVAKEIAGKIVLSAFDWKSWVSQTIQKDYSIAAGDISSLNPIAMTPFADGGRVGAILREEFDYMNPRKVALALFDPSDPLNTAIQCDLGKWGTINYVHAQDGIAMISGDLVNETGWPIPSVLFAGFDGGKVWTHVFTGQDALALGSSDIMVPINHGLEMALSGPSGVYIVSRQPILDAALLTAPPGSPCEPEPADGSQEVRTRRHRPVLKSLKEQASRLTDISNITVTLRWRYARGARSYDLYLWSDKETKPTTATVQGLTVGRWTVAPPILSDTTYHWQVVAYNANGHTAGAEWSFKTAPPLPDPPLNPSPEDNAENVPVNTDLSWGRTGHAESWNVTVWSLDFDEQNPDGSFPVFFSAQNLSEPSAAISNLTRGKRYMWKVEALNAAGKTEGPCWLFRGAVPPPKNPEDPAPKDGATITPDVASFYWMGQTDVQYDIYFWSDDVSTPTLPTVSGMTSSRFDLPSPLEDGKSYRWFVRAINGAGSAIGETWTVHVNKNASGQGGVEFTDGIIPPPFGADIPTGTLFGWPEREGALQYDLYLWELGDEIPAWPSWDGLHQTQFTPPAPLKYGTVYEWRVRFWTSPEDYIFRGPYMFKTEAAPPELLPGVPGLVFPADPVLPVSVNATLEWSASKSDAFDLYLWKEADMGLAEIPPIEIDLPQNSWTPSAPLDYSTTYWWRVAAKNEYGSAQGPPWSFTTAGEELSVIDFPDIPVSLYPPNRQAGIVPEDDLEWTTGTLCASYDLYLWKEGGTGTRGAFRKGDERYTQPDTPWATDIQTNHYSLKDAALEPGEIYYWRIAAHNFAGTSFGPTRVFTVAGPPGPCFWALY